MTSNQMIDEIRHAHPDAYVEDRPGVGWIVWTYYPDGRELSNRGSIYEAVLHAHRAVRKARPKPPTVAQSKVKVRERYPKATWGLLVDRETQRRWFYIWDGEGNTDPRWGKGDTIGQAWKAAAAALPDPAPVA